jgi:hypothetical protein
MDLSTTMVCRYYILKFKTYYPVISEAHRVYLFHLRSVLEVVQYQHTLLGLLCLEESGKLLWTWFLIQGKEISYKYFICVQLGVCIQFCQLLFKHNLVCTAWWHQWGAQTLQGTWWHWYGTAELSSTPRSWEGHSKYSYPFFMYAVVLIEKKCGLLIVSTLCKAHCFVHLNWFFFLIFLCLHVSSFNVWRNALVTIYKHLRVYQEHWEWCMLHPSFKYTPFFLCVIIKCKLRHIILDD